MMFGWHETPWMWVSMVLFGSVFVVLAFYAVKALSNPTAEKSRTPAREILEQRFARGEISVEEYRARRETLASTRTPPAPSS